MYALVVNDVTMSPAAMWSHDHAKLSDVDALHSRCVAELAEVAALLRNVNVSSSSCCHVMTGAIKRALRSYAPLLTFAAHDAWVEAAASGDERRLAKLAVSLPPTSAWLLSELLAHAKAVLAQTSENRMTSLSLAITLFVNVLRVEDAAGASFGSERMTEFFSYSYLLSPSLSPSLSSLSLSLSLSVPPSHSDPGLRQRRGCAHRAHFARSSARGPRPSPSSADSLLSSPPIASSAPRSRRKRRQR